MKHLFLVLSVMILTTAYAGDKPPADAEADSDSCTTDAGTYDHGALNFFHSMLCLGNKRFAGMAENIFYHLVVDMGLDVSPDALPADGTLLALTPKTFKSKTVTGYANLVVTGDTAGFFGTYDYHASLLVDSVQFMDVYWSGKGTESKGYLVMIPTEMKGATAGGEALLYIRWDRVLSTAQSIEALVTRFATTYLGSALTDRAAFYKATFNDTSKDVTVQLTSIEGQRGTPSSFGCYTMYGTGALGGTMTVGKTADAFNLAGHAVGLTAQDGLTPNWDDFEGDDLKTTANGSGNGTVVQGFAMNYSCSDLNGQGGVSKAFTGNTVSFTKTKTEVDTMFGVN